MVFRRLRSMFGGAERGDVPPAPLYGLEEDERERIGTEEDPLLDFEAAMQRNEAAERHLQTGDATRAIDLFEKSVSEVSSAATLTSGWLPSTRAAAFPPKR